MFRLRKPNKELLARIRDQFRHQSLTYAEAGCTRGPAPPGYSVDHYRCKLGEGPDVFRKARQVIASWKMLDLGWALPCWPDAELKQDELTGTIAHVYGIWSINVCRVVYVEESEAPTTRFAFAYGTLPGHPGDTTERSASR